MTSDQEAVCGTCGHPLIVHAGGFCDDCKYPENRHIPVPVVPSDDGEHERDEERWLLTPGKWQPEESAPPIPPQDAEGDGLYRYEESMGARCCITCLALPGEPHADGCHALALVSSIRADYEELVKAAQAYDVLCEIAESGMPVIPYGKEQDTFEQVSDRLRAAVRTLTRIEEPQKHD